MNLNTLKYGLKKQNIDFYEFDNNEKIEIELKNKKKFLNYIQNSIDDNSAFQHGWVVETLNSVSYFLDETYRTHERYGEAISSTHFMIKDIAVIGVEEEDGELFLYIDVRCGGYDYRGYYIKLTNSEKEQAIINRVHKEMGIANL